MKENNLTNQTDDWRHRMMWPKEIQDEALLVMESMPSKGNDPFENDIYFVNNSGQTIDKVCYSMGGFCTDDDGVVPMYSESERCYDNIKHGEAVRFDVSTFFDQDFMISYAFQIESRHLNISEVCSETQKGGASSAVFLWADLPDPFNNPDDPSQTLDAKGAARRHVSEAGKTLPKTVPINKGDLYYGAGDERLRREGIYLNRTAKHGGKVTLYEFTNEDGAMIYHTIVLDDAIAFIEALKSG
jgi:hypothetical protein